MLIRPARPEDFSQVAPLIVQAMEDLAYTFVGTKEIKKTYPLFEHFFKLPKNQYSYKHTLVCESDGKIAGSVTAYDGGLLPIYRAPFLKYIEEKYNIKNLVIENECMPGEFYIDTVSVSLDFQGKGIGKKLLQAITKQAREEGQQKIGLLVDYENPDAKRLYLALGYKSVGKNNSGMDFMNIYSSSCFSFLRMIHIGITRQFGFIFLIPDFFIQI